MNNIKKYLLITTCLVLGAATYKTVTRINEIYTGYLQCQGDYRAISHVERLMEEVRTPLTGKKYAKR